MTTGSLPADHVHQPPPASADTWEATVTPPMVSAYVAANGKEPEYTNLARTQFMPEDTFCETLDYIFLSAGDWASPYAKPLASKAKALEASQSYPTAEEASDHVLIFADLDLEPEGVGKAAGKAKAAAAA